MISRSADKLLLVGTAMLAGVGPARAEAGVEKPGLAIESSTEGAIRIAGSAYKASFDEAGAQVVPFLGSSAPRNYPLTLRLDELRSGERALPFQRAVTPTRDGEWITYDRGGVVELYRPDVDGVEQAFRFDERPSKGDLELRIAFETELSPALDAQGLRFMGPFGGLRYGKATAIDARGASVDVPLTLDCDVIELRVSAAFLAHATFPILVDPLISTLSIDTSTADDGQPEVAYDASLDRYLVCWERTFSLNDHDVFGQVLDGAGATVRTFALDLSGGEMVRPAVAGIDALDQFLVVVATDYGASHRLEGRIVDLSGGGFSIAPPQVLMTGLYFTNHDLGGDSGTVAPLRYCLVAEDTGFGCFEIQTRLVSSDGLPGLEYTFTGDCDFVWRGPRISKTAVGPGAGPRSWAMSYEDHFGGILLRSRLISTDGTHYGDVSLSSSMAGNTPRNEAICLVAPDQYVVVWNNTSSVDRLFAREVTGTVKGPVRMVSENPLVDHLDAAADSDGEGVVISYVERDQPDVSEPVHAATFQLFEGALILAEREEVSVDLTRAADTDLTAARGAAGGTSRYLAAWRSTPASHGNIDGALYDGLVGVIERYCLGGINSTGERAAIHPRGSIALDGNEFELTLSDGPPNQFGIFLLGTNQAMLPFGEGFLCVGGSIRRIPPVVMIGADGDASVSLDFDRPYGQGVSPGPPGVNYQFWYRDPAGGPAGFNLSDAIRVEHTR